MKILFITSYYPPLAGGSAVVYYNLCRYLREKALVLTTWRHYVDGRIICEERGEPGKAVVPTVIRVELLRPIVSQRVSPSLTKAAWRVLSTDIPLRLNVLRAVRRIIKQHAVDVVCIGELYALAWLGKVLKNWWRMPCIYYVHGEEITTNASSRFYGRGALDVLRRADATIVVSNFTRSEVVQRGIPESKVHLISNGVDVESFTPGPVAEEIVARHGLHGKWVLLTVGRVEERKGHDAVIRSLPRVLRQHPNTVYLIVGAGARVEYLRALSRDMAVEAQVIFAGLVPEGDLVKYYRTADVFVMPNRTLPNGDTEGFGLVFLEANACGKPVIGGNVGGVPDAIVDGETGKLVDGSSIDAVASAVNLLLEEKELTRRMGEAGRRRALTFGWQSKADQFQAVCQEILKQ